MPQALQDRGGMLNPEIVHMFDAYADVLFRRYGDRVQSWITFNEPWVFCEQGYGSGYHAPLVRSPGVGVYVCAHHVLLANALIYQRYQRKYRGFGGRVGIALNCEFAYPKQAGVASHAEAADRAMLFMCGHYMQPIFGKTGGYPQAMVETIARRSRREGRERSRLPEMTAEERELIRGKADFVGVNYYTSGIVAPAKRPEETPPSNVNDVEVEESVDPRWKRAEKSRIYSVPAGLRDTLNWIRVNFDNPLMIITENGWCDDGRLNDTDRIAYLRGHLQATLDAIDDGCNVRGHTTWTLLDNLEWRNGYTERFGLYHVDIGVAERTRTPKASVAFLREVVRTRTLPTE